MIKVAKEQAPATRARILEKAAQSFRERGFADVAVAGAQPKCVATAGTRAAGRDGKPADRARVSDAALSGQVFRRPTPDGHRAVRKHGRRDRRGPRHR